MLFADPDRVIDEYGLDDEDAGFLSSLDREEFVQFAAMFDLGIIQNLNDEEVREFLIELEERMSKANIHFRTIFDCMEGGGCGFQGFTETMMDSMPTLPTARCK